MPAAPSTPSSVPGQLTDPATVTGTDVTVEVPDGRMAGYLARPVAPGPWPGLLLVHEAYGLNAHIQDVARRLAGTGFVVLAPDLYWRTGRPDPNDSSAIWSTMFAVTDAACVADLETAAAFLRGLDIVSGRVGCIGFCFGGRQTLVLASLSNALDAAVDCWGGFLDRASADERTTPARPRPAVELADGLSCPLLLVAGAEDRNPSPVLLEALGASLRRDGKQAEVRIFDDAGHAFFADYRESYREAAAFRLWPVLLHFLATHLA